MVIAEGTGKMFIDHREAMCLSDFESIYEQYYKRVYNYCFYRTANHHDAEELTSGIFERAVTKYNTFDARKSPFEAWLFMLAQSVVVDFHRANGRKKQRSVCIDDAEGEPYSGRSPEDAAIGGEISVFLAEALSALPEREKNIILLKYIVRLKNKEIVSVTGLSESHIGVILHRALKKLRKELLRKGVDVDV